MQYNPAALGAQESPSRPTSRATVLLRSCPPQGGSHWCDSEVGLGRGRAEDSGCRWKDIFSIAKDGVVDRIKEGMSVFVTRERHAAKVYK